MVLESSKSPVTEHDAARRTVTRLVSAVLLRPAEGTFIQAFRFGVVGAAATVADFAVLFVLTHFLHVPYLISGAFGFALGLTVSYILSVRWVFTTRRLTSAHIEFAAFVIIGIIGLGLTELLLYAGVERLGLHYLVAKALAVAIVFAWNFGVRKVLLFR